jgi:hypothetical protein
MNRLVELPVIEKEALLLSDAERALLADRLLVSLNVGTEEFRKKWIAEAESRLAAFHSGAIQAVEGPEVLDSLRAQYGK